MRELSVMVLKLFVITLIAGVILGGAYVLTKQPIKDQQLKAATAAREAVFSGAEFEALDTDGMDREPLGIIAAYNATVDGKLEGYVVEMVVVGYGGDIGLTVGIDLDGKINGISIGSHMETPGLGAKTADESFYSQFVDKTSNIHVVKSNPSDDEIEALTGATITSDAVTLGAQIAIDFVENFK